MNPKASIRNNRCWATWPIITGDRRSRGTPRAWDRLEGSSRTRGAPIGNGNRPVKLYFVSKMVWTFFFEPFRALIREKAKPTKKRPPTTERAKPMVNILSAAPCIGAVLRLVLSYRNRACVLPKAAGALRRCLWGGPPGPRGSPWTRPRPHGARCLGIGEGRRGRRPRTRGSAPQSPRGGCPHTGTRQSAGRTAGRYNGVWMVRRR